MKYEKLFQPGKIGNLELRNRVVMTAMGALMGDWNGCTTPEQRLDALINALTHCDMAEIYRHRRLVW